MASSTHWILTGTIGASAALLILGESERPAAQDTRAEISELIVLGDSLSDIGNVAAVADFVLGERGFPTPTIGLCNPVERLVLDRDCNDLAYARSRVTNGPVAVEHLAAHLGVGGFAPSLHTVPERSGAGANYAVAGATARGDGLKDLRYQLDVLLADRGGVLPEQSLVVVMIGGNDAIDTLQAEALPRISEPADSLPDASDGDGADAPSSEADRIIADATLAIAEGVARLLDQGAGCILVANVPDLALLPAVRAAEEVASNVTSAFNAELDARLAEIETAHPAGDSIVRFDFSAVLTAARADAVMAGLNVTDACFDSKAYIGPDATRRFHPDCAPAGDGLAPDFDSFFFWDEIHPTAIVHERIGAALIEHAALCQ
ncbi:MAG: SGNH/GDSL hydrolase family protein [Gammaproteobacteria bacterium]|nr:hypothetical protein [Gammaproteobacteria bacterium]